MQPGLVESRRGDVRRIDDPRFPFVSEPDEPVEDVLRQVMFAVHVEQCARPDSALGKQIAERLHPNRFDEEEIQARFGAMLLDAMNEQIIRVQLMGHHQVINPRHHSEYLAGRRALSMVPRRPGGALACGVDPGMGARNSCSAVRFLNQ